MGKGDSDFTWLVIWIESNVVVRLVFVLSGRVMMNRGEMIRVLALVTIVMKFDSKLLGLYEALGIDGEKDQVMMNLPGHLMKHMTLMGQ